MRSSWRSICVAGGAGLLLAVSAADAGAQASVYLDCGSTDSCYADITTDTGTATPLHIQWAFAIPYGTDVRFKKDCTNSAFCGFWCPHREAILTATVTVTDANGALLGTDTEPAGCTQQPEPGM
jgi:hypothetical protein